MADTYICTTSCPLLTGYVFVFDRKIIFRGNLIKNPQAVKDFLFLPVKKLKLTLDCLDFFGTIIMKF